MAADRVLPVPPPADHRPDGRRWHYVTFVAAFRPPPPGLTASDPAFWFGGLWLSRLGPMPEDLELFSLGRPLIYRTAQQMLWGVLPDGQLLHLHPVARAPR